MRLDYRPSFVCPNETHLVRNAMRAPTTDRSKFSSVELPQQLRPPKIESPPLSNLNQQHLEM
jgi:hypothetical protein